MTITDPFADGDFDAHPREALSCLLDGELDPRTAEIVRAHLAGCRECAEELQWTRATRWSLRNLPPVEPPPGFVDLAVARYRRDDARRTTDQGEDALVVALAPRRRPRPGAVRVSAGAAAGLALFALSVLGAEPRPYEPAMDAAVGRHAAALSVLAVGGLAGIDGGADPLEGERFTPPPSPTASDPEDVPAPFRAPVRLDGGYRLVEAFTHPEGLHLVYRHGRYGLSLFEARGRLDGAGLPSEGWSIEVAGVTGWRWEGDEIAGRVVVFERDGVVVTVVGDEPGEAVTDAARSVPEPRPLSLAQRVSDAGVGVFEALSP